MPLLTANGSTVLRAVVTIPRLGAWVADVEVETDTPLTGAVTLAVDSGPTWHGTVVGTAAVVQNTWRGRIVAGAGGLAKVLDPLAYQTAALADVVGDALRTAGEVLSGTASDLSAQIGHWQRQQQPCSSTVADVALAAGYAWRVLADGTVWLGAESWDTAAGDPTQMDVIARDARCLIWTLAGDTLALTPGTIVTLPVDDAGDLQGMAIDTVRHSFDGAEVSTMVWEYPSTTSSDPSARLQAALEAVIQRTMRKATRAPSRPCTVVAQASDGTLHLQPDDPTEPPCQGIPIRHGIPGVTGVQVAAGARVRLCFDNGDPSKPYAALWDAGTGVAVTIQVGTFTVTGGVVQLGGASLTALQGVVNGQAIDTLTGATQASLGNASTVVLAAKS
jgi:hypothetical protein